MSAVDHLLTADIREALALVPFGPINADNLDETRIGRYGTIDPSLLTDRVERSSIVIPGPSGQPDVKLRVHRPTGATGPLPCLYWMHGGGMIIGNAEQDDLRFDHWCARHQIVAVSVEYRLAPETPYPGAIEDCFAGLCWVSDHADQLGVDAARIGIGGASAGAGLAASLALLARDRGRPSPGVFSQLLIYPMLDDRQVTESSSWDVPIWPPSSNRFGWDSYLGGLRGDAVPAYAAAARATDVSGLPPALIVVGTLDGFIDEDVEFALRLNRAQVPVELHVYPGAPHGFDGLLPGAAVSRQASKDIHDWIARTYAR